VFFIIALIAYVFGRPRCRRDERWNRTHLVLFVFLVLAIIFLIVGLIGGGPVV